MVRTASPMEKVCRLLPAASSSGSCQYFIYLFNCYVIIIINILQTSVFPCICSITPQYSDFSKSLPGQNVCQHIVRDIECVLQTYIQTFRNLCQVPASTRRPAEAAHIFQGGEKR